MRMSFKTHSLPPEVLHIVRDKGTELPFTGEYTHWDKSGTFLCRQCGLALFRSYTQFDSGCGWASFDEELPQAVHRKPDADGKRTEILCHRCDAHLGHVFQGEQMTGKNTRHCVNSPSLDFVEDMNIKDTEEALLGCGCFWGVEYYFKKLPGVLKTEAGYTGGHTAHPRYQDVCAGNTGHIETLRIIYDPQTLNYEKLIQYFFEIHDFTQNNGQGPDIGGQYLSVIFYYNDAQKKIAEQVIQLLQDKKYFVATQIQPVSVFWPAEAYHQEYYQKNHQSPYCHTYTKRF
jgi:peptide methionine sulfoxide reductase msrA/msrB